MGATQRTMASGGITNNANPESAAKSVTDSGVITEVIANCRFPHLP